MYKQKYYITRLYIIIFTNDVEFIEIENALSVCTANVGVWYLAGCWWVHWSWDLIALFVLECLLSVVICIVK